VCYVQNSLQISNKLLSHFPVQVYNGLEVLAETIMNPANCRSVAETDKSNFTASEPIFVYTDIIKPNLVGTRTLSS
jgi:hypothetical protein